MEYLCISEYVTSFVSAHKWADTCMISRMSMISCSAQTTRWDEWGTVPAAAQWLTRTLETHVVRADYCLVQARLQQYKEKDLSYRSGLWCSVREKTLSCPLGRESEMLQTSPALCVNRSSGLPEEGTWSREAKWGWREQRERGKWRQGCTLGFQSIRDFWARETWGVC